MAYDPLAKFRPPAAAGDIVLPANDPEGVVILPEMAGEVYQAFKPVSQETLRLRIIQANGQTETATNTFLKKVASDGTHGTNFILSYVFMEVHVRGRNLLPVVNAIEKDQCVYIQEFDPRRWPEPARKELPFISEIVVHVEGTGPEPLKAPQLPEEKQSKDEKKIMRLAARMLSEKLLKQMQPETAKVVKE